MQRVFTIYLCIFSFSLLVSKSSARIPIKEEISFYWNKFWATSCHFSPSLSRTRRSIDLPDINNPKELFDYLLPLANVKPEDFASAHSGSRSFTSAYASSWIDDFVDLWQQECHRRRHQDRNDQSVPIPRRHKRKVKKRSTVRNQGLRREDKVTWENYPQNLTYVYAYSPMTTTASPSSFPVTSSGDEEEQMEEVEEKEEEEELEVGEDEDEDELADDLEVDNDEYEKNKDMTTVKTEVEEHKKEEDGEVEEEEEDEETTTEAIAATVAPFSRLSAIPADSGTEYFASYGGDVEYFFPLIAFGIPFDGLITVLGYHGFRGVFTV